MKILLISNFGINEITPRAFRVKSLFHAFHKLGHDVELVTARNQKREKDYAQTNHKGRFTCFTRSIASRILSQSIPDGKVFFTACKVYPKLKNKSVDLTISIGLPFTIHLMTALALRSGRLKTKTVVADYGDPYSGNPVGSYPFYAKTLERWVLSHFDKIAVPLEGAIAAYDNVVVSPNQIKVIPQGCNIKRDLSKCYTGNAIPTFAYAGVLYKETRDPSLFFEELVKIKTPFVFYFYTDFGNSHTMEILKPFLKKLTGKLYLHRALPRDKCLEKLSRMDFLISFPNKSTIQAPSKLIDYTLSSRPFLEISQDEINFTKFYKYLSGDYSDFSKPDISMFDEIAVANRFIACIPSKDRPD